MHFKRALEAGRRPRRLAGVAGALLFLSVVMTATAEPPATVTRVATMDRNRVILLLTDSGEIGASDSSGMGGGFWITKQNQYIHSSGINIGARIPNGDNDGNAKDTAAYIGGPYGQVYHGSLEFAKLPSATGLGTGVSSAAGIFWDSTIPEDAANFPEPCTVDAFRQKLFPSLAPFAGQPFPGFADQTICFAANDITGGVCADCGGKRLGAESVQTTFAFAVPAVQDFVFAAFRIYNRSEFINASNAPSNAPGPYTFENAELGFAIDPDIGDSGDDQITFFPNIGTMVFWDSNFNEPGFIGTPGFGAVSMFPVPDPDTGEAFRLQYFTLFVRGQLRPDPESPQEWYERLTGDPRFAYYFEAPPSEISGMASTNAFDLEPGKFVEIYAAYFFAPVAGSPPELLLAEDPYHTLPNGDPDYSSPDPTANTDPAFANIIRTQQTAQVMLDAGFVVPMAPPRPDFSLIPGDHQVTVVWDASPVEFVDPFAKVAHDPFKRLLSGRLDEDAPSTGVVLRAVDTVYDPATDSFESAADAGLTGTEVTNPAFNASFVIRDFQGFRVYRSYTGRADDATLIAQYDRNDAITGGVFCVAAVPVFAGGEFVQNVCTDQQELSIGTNTGLGFAVVDRGGSFPDPSSGPGLINGIPVYYTVTSFSANTGQSPAVIPPGTSVVPAPAPLVLEAGLQPFESATPRTNPSSLTTATVGDAALLDGAGNVVTDTSDIPFGARIDVDGDPATGDTVHQLTGPIPPAKDWGISVAVVQPTEIPRDFTLLFHIDSVSVSPGYAHGNGCGSDDNLAVCVWGDGVFDEIPAGDNRSRQVWFHATDGDGNPLRTPTGPAVGHAVTGFIPFTGVTNFTAPEMQILSPDDTSHGVAFSVTYSSAIGQRGNSCPIGEAPCQVRTPDGSGVPASVAVASFSRGLYGQYTVADVELTWSNRGGTLGLSSVHDVSDDVDVSFRGGFGTEGWGFSKPTGLGPAEGALADATGAPRTDDGKVLFPDPNCSGLTGGFPGDCLYYGYVGGMTQSGPAFSDLPVDPDVFDELAPYAGTYAAVPWHQPDAFQETAALVTVDGRQATRLYVAGQFLDLIFNQLPSDGETWLVRLPIDDANGEPPRPPVPGMTIRVPLSGATNELADADLSAIRVVPNPFVAADEIQRGDGLQGILFTHLPPRCTIRIYTISGNLLRVLEHSDGSGTERWDVRTLFDLLVASGNYYYHVTTPDGRTSLGRFAVVN